MTEREREREIERERLGQRDLTNDLFSRKVEDRERGRERGGEREREEKFFTNDLFSKKWLGKVLVCFWFVMLLQIIYIQFSKLMRKIDRMIGSNKYRMKNGQKER